MVSDITDKLLPKIEEWQNRPLSAVYPIVFIDAVHFSVRNDGVIRKLAVYVVLGINEEGKKEIPAITIGENESSKYWLSVLNSLKNRGVKDILILCSDGLDRDQRGHHGCVPVNGAAEVYRPHGAQHAEICRKQGHEGICKRPEDNLHCAE